MTKSKKNEEGEKEKLPPAQKCDICDAKVTPSGVAWCQKNTKSFDGKVLCFTCQKEHSQNKRMAKLSGSSGTDVITLNENEYSVTNSPIVKPVVSIEEAVELWNTFEELKNKIATQNDYVDIVDKKTKISKRFLKKSFWRKAATFFNLSDEIVEERRTDLGNGHFMWHIKAGVIAPNGRRVVEVGVCDSRERNFAHPEHDIYATAHTRAKSRAISAMIGGGEVTAEEVL